MSKTPNIDNLFQQAFDHWDAPFSKEEMASDWSQLKQHIPQAPVQQAPATGSGAGAAGAGMGKLALWMGGVGALVTSAVVLYNIYVKDTPQPVVNTQPSSEKAATADAKPAAQTQNTIVYQEPAEKMPVSGGSPVKKSSSGHRGAADVGHSGKHQPLHKESQTSSSGNVESGTATSNNPVLPPKAANSNSVRDVASQESRSDNTPSPMAQMNLPASTVCVGQAVNIYATNQAKNATLNWGDGFIAKASAENIHVYTKPGHYHIQLNSANGKIDNWLNVEAIPKANFNYTQNRSFRVHIDDLSENSSRYLMDFGDGFSRENTDEHIYPDTGIYKVMMVAYNNAGCSDTMRQLIRITGKSMSLRNNIITPNGDGRNDELELGSFEGAAYYHLVIIDISGKLVFETNDANQHWGGLYPDGTPAPSGSYYYVLQYVLQNTDKVQVEKDAIRLQR